MKRIVLTIFVVGFLITVTTPWMMAADSNETSLGLPTANMSVGNLVPLGIVKKVALKKAKGFWGQVTPGEPIACCDQEGKIAYYMCPFHIGPGPFPSYEQIMKAVKEGRGAVEAVQDGQVPSGLDEKMKSFEAAQKNEPIILNSGPDMPQAEVPMLPEGAPVQDYDKAYKTAKSMELGIGEYGTVYVAATYDQFPVPLISNYLAPYYLTADLAQQKAKEMLGGNPKLKCIYFLGMRGTYFEFVSGNSSGTIHAYSLESEPIEHVEQVVPPPDYQQHIREEWNKATEEADME